MLVLARKVGQSIIISDNIELTVIEVRGEQVRIGIQAPRSIAVHRKELLEQIKADNIKASVQGIADDQQPDVLKKNGHQIGNGKQGTGLRVDGNQEQTVTGQSAS